MSSAVEDDSALETSKRRRELVLTVGLGILFCVLTGIEIRLLGVSERLPFVYSIFFFGLVNFNIVILLGLFFFIFRNIVKVFVERQGKVIGSSLKGKLIAAFVAFSSVPTILMFLVSVFYINSSFDKWFSVKMAGVLKSSLEVTNESYLSAKKRNYHFAQQLVRRIDRENQRELKLHKHGLSEDKIRALLAEGVRDFRLDAVEYYPDILTEPVLVTGDKQTLPEVPRATLEFLKKGLQQRSEDSTIHQWGQGNLVRVIVPLPREGQGGVIVSSFTPLSLLSQISDISSAYEDFRNINPLEYPLRSIYLLSHPRYDDAGNFIVWNLVWNLLGTSVVSAVRNLGARNGACGKGKLSTCRYGHWLSRNEPLDSEFQSDDKCHGQFPKRIKSDFGSTG